MLRVFFMAMKPPRGVIVVASFPRSCCFCQIKDTPRSLLSASAESQRSSAYNICISTLGFWVGPAWQNTMDVHHWIPRTKLSHDGFLLSSIHRIHLDSNLFKIIQLCPLVKFFLSLLFSQIGLRYFQPFFYFWIAYVTGKIE